MSHRTLVSLAFAFLLLLSGLSALVPTDQSSSSGQSDVLANQAPVPMIGVGMIFLDVEANGSASYDPDGYITSYVWTWGDDTPESYGAVARHHYESPCTGRQKGYIVTLTVTDNFGATSSKWVSIRPPAPPGKVPRVLFNITQNGLAVHADASGSFDLDGYIIQYTWIWGDNSAKDYGMQASHNYPDTGEYVIRLTVKDNSSLVSWLEQLVYVERTGWEPVASFTAASSYLTVIVNALASYDPDGNITSYCWDWEDGTTSYGVVTTHTYPNTHSGRRPGVYLVTLVVTDDSGLESSCYRVVPVSEPPRPPVAVMNTSVRPLGLSAVGSSSYDVDGYIIGWSWDFGDGSGATGPVVNHSYAQAGKYLVTLTVTDNQTLKNSTSALVDIGPGVAPHAVFRFWTNGLETSTDARESHDDDGYIVSWTWSWGDGANGNRERDSHKFSHPGSYVVVLTVVDDTGLNDSVSHPVSVNYMPPVALFSAYGIFQAVEVFARDSYDPDGNITSYTWSWGDGKSTSGSQYAVHSYATAGLYNITLTLTDNQGMSSSKSLEYNATARPTPSGAFSSSNRVDNAANGSTQRNPSIVSQGTSLYAVWEDERDGRSQIYFSRSSDRGLTWSASLKVNKSSSANAAQCWPSIAVGPDGSLYVVWHENRTYGGNINVYLARSDDGGTSFGPAVRVDDTGVGYSWQDMPSVAVSMKGVVVVVWRDDREGIGQLHVYGARSMDKGANFSANFRIDDSTGTNVASGFPSITVDATGRFYVVWNDNRDGNSNVYLSRSTDNGLTFSSSKRVDDTGTSMTGQGNPQVGAAGDGYVFVVWLDNRNGKYEIYGARSLDGGVTFGANVQIASPSGQTEYSLPRLAVDAWRNVYVTWQAIGSADETIMFCMSIDAGATFSMAKTVSDAPAESYCTSPRVAADLQGGLYLLWTDDRMDEGDIRGARASMAVTYPAQAVQSMGDPGVGSQVLAAMVLGREQ